VAELKKRGKMKQVQKLISAMPGAKAQAKQLFFTTHDNTASETILKVTMGPLLLWACFYSVLPWLLG
jgi:hypothetical protein